MDEKNYRHKLLVALIPQLSRREVWVLYPILESYLERPHNNLIKEEAFRILKSACLLDKRTSRLILIANESLERKLRLISKGIWDDLGGNWYFDKLLLVKGHRTLCFTSTDISLTLVLYYCFIHRDTVTPPPRVLGF